MAKRSSHFQLKHQTSKKPKLKISFSNKDYSTTIQAKVATKINIESENLWNDEDDDDEVILLASQAVETIEKCKQQIMVNNENLENINFSQFHREATTSTQLNKSLSNPLDNFFADSDDDFDNIGEILIKPNNKTNDNNKISLANKNKEFKVPSTKNLLVKKSTIIEEKSKNNEDLSDKYLGTNNSKDMQVSYLMSKLETMKKENELLTSNAGTFSEKLQVKDGEITMLRHELAHLKQLNDNFRLEKIQQNDISRKEWQDKIHELEKSLKSHKSEIEFKNLEICNLKSKKLNELSYNVGLSSTKQQLDQECLQSLFNLHISTKNTDLRPHNIPSEIFEKTLIKLKKSNYRETLLNEKLEIMQSILAKVSTNKSLRDKDQQEVSSIVKFIFEDFYNFTNELDFAKYQDTNVNTEYKFLCNKFVQKILYKSQTEEANIYQAEKLYQNEKSSLIRRCIAGITLLYDNNQIIKCNPEVYWNEQIFDKIIDGIDRVGYSKNPQEHFGLLIALGKYLNILLKDFKDKNEFQNYVQRFIKSLIFCRLDRKGLQQVSYSLVNIIEKSNNLNIINSLCTKSQIGSFIVNEYYKIFQFSPNACTLQVYGALLYVALPQYEELNKNEILSLADLCYNHIKFLRICFQKHIKWIYRSPSENLSCDCYVKATTSFIILFHLFIKSWLNNPKNLDIKYVSNICKMGTLLISDIFHINYRKDVFQIGGSTIKNRLSIIYDWLINYSEILTFQSAHVNALQLVKLNHIMADPLKSSNEELLKETCEIGEQIWQQIFSDFV